MTNEIWNFYITRNLGGTFYELELSKAVATLPVKRELNISIKMNVNKRPFLKQKQQTGVIMSIIKTEDNLYFIPSKNRFRDRVSH